MNLLASLKRIPWLLRIVALASLCLGLLLPLLALIPGTTFNLAGTVLSHEQHWASGVVFAIFASAPLMLIVSLGVLFHGRWVRWLLVALPFLQLLPFQVTHSYFGAPDPAPALREYVLCCVVWATAALAYLLLWPPARHFFERAPNYSLKRTADRMSR